MDIVGVASNTTDGADAIESGLRSNLISFDVSHDSPFPRPIPSHHPDRY